MIAAGEIVEVLGAYSSETGQREIEGDEYGGCEAQVVRVPAHGPDVLVWIRGKGQIWLHIARLRRRGGV